MYVQKNESVIYFDFFGVENIPKEIKVSLHNNNIIRNIFRIQAHYSVMRGYFCIRFIDFMFSGKNLTE